ncbi:hypothetical protein EIK77_009130 [Talaromyces pinophilus]|nr:hypothetical protein EIK77_009130 [Talaromyces pinophilus]PCH07931.1 Hypothetical protein PENO1_009340 [Penicillium occitanis (nom. inval.)]PCH09901.1 hypothetical protein PENOC_006550 [Penicillium occitanis (nom. inval.)]
MEAPPPPKTVNLSGSTVGLAKPTIMTKFEDHKDKDMAKGEFYVIKHDKQDKDCGKLCLYIRESINTANDEPSKELPWDVLLIMTTKWLIVARPEPQKEADKAKAQAKFIWGEVKKLLENAEDRKDIDTMFCWVFVPQEGGAFRIRNDVIPLPTREREKIYENTFYTEGMKEIDGLENRILEVQPYVLGGTAGTLSQAVAFRGRIAIQDVGRFLDRYSGLKKKFDFEKYWNSDYKELGFPLITLMAEKHLLNNADGDWNDLTDYENTTVKWHDGELIPRLDSSGSDE